MSWWLFFIALPYSLLSLHLFYITDIALATSYMEQNSFRETGKNTLEVDNTVSEHL